MASHAELIRKRDDKAAARADSAKAPARGGDPYHALLNGRAEIGSMRNQARGLNVRPPLAAQRKAADALARSRPDGARSLMDNGRSASATHASPLRPLQPQQSPAVAQLKRVPVGFDRVAGTKAADDSLVTTGLANCIAVAAQDTNTGAAVMGHFDTLHAYNPATKKFNDSILEAFRTHLLEELGRVAGAKPKPVFHVSVGTVWLGSMADIDSPSNDPWWFMRHSLLGACAKVFGKEPSQGGSSAEFFLGAALMQGSAVLAKETGAISAPKDDPHGRAGAEIPYDKIKESGSKDQKSSK
jgi:hypothetical protein